MWRHFCLFSLLRWFNLAADKEQKLKICNFWEKIQNFIFFQFLAEKYISGAILLGKKYWILKKSSCRPELRIRFFIIPRTFFYFGVIFVHCPRSDGSIWLQIRSASSKYALFFSFWSKNVLVALFYSVKSIRY